MNVVGADQMKFVLAVTIWQRGVWRRDYAALIVSEGGETIRVPVKFSLGNEAAFVKRPT